jgi:hypothetical protein
MLARAWSLAASRFREMAWSAMSMPMTRASGRRPTTAKATPV